MRRATGGKEPGEREPRGRGSEVLKSLLATLIGVVIALVLAEVFVRIFFDEAVQPRYVID